MRKNIVAIAVIFITGVSFSKAGELWMPAIFSDNMVLQREMPVPVWGKTSPGSTITVEIAGSRIQTIAGFDGKWMLKLPPAIAGGSFEMKVTTGETKIFKNVMFGDVWFASGQSNMEFAVSTAKNAKKEIAEAGYSNIRLFTIPKTKAVNPAADVPGGPWLICDSSSVKNFSAVAYFFGRNLHLDKKVPIGLIHSSWGGTAAESWISRDMVSIFPDFKKKIDDVKSGNLTDALLAEDIKKVDIRWQIANSSLVGLTQNVHKIEYDDKGWKTMTVPKSIDESELGPSDAVIWFRKVIELPEEFKEKNLILKIGKVDHMDITYFNGVEVGHSAWTADQVRTYSIPAKLVKEGKNIIAVRDADLWGKGGLNGPADSMFICVNSKKPSSIMISGDWKYNNTIEPEIPKTQGADAPGLIFNAMVAPVIPYGIKGAIWYQGESNASRAYQYRMLLPLMISDWRVRWGQGDFPFLIVQLANFHPLQTEPGDGAWPELREAQMMTTAYPNVGIACAVDLGDAYDIHPTNKQDVGKRLALSAEKIAYGDNIIYSGPVYQSMKIEGKTIRLKFSNTGSGMTVKGDKLKGFTIAGDDRKFYWADAKIEGNEIIVSSDKVAAPVSVRYAWANNPVCNLYNKEGLPAFPFRTDDWPGITANNK